MREKLYKKVKSNMEGLETASIALIVVGIVLIISLIGSFIITSFTTAQGDVVANQTIINSFKWLFSVSLIFEILSLILLGISQSKKDKYVLYKGKK